MYSAYIQRMISASSGTMTSLSSCHSYPKMVNLPFGMPCLNRLIVPHLTFSEMLRLSSCAKEARMHHCFTENFMMFPISARRMIVEIDPFYKFRQMYAGRYLMPPLSSLTVLNNENLYFPNDVRYKLPQDGLQFKYHPDDRYIYQIKKLTDKETQYCNALFLDRIDTYCGFSSLDKAVQSIICYRKLNEPPYTPRIDYSGLYEVIRQRTVWWA